MTGVLEVAALAALGAAWNSGKNQGLQEKESLAQSLYQRFFQANLFERAPSEASCRGTSLPSGLEPRAATCIKIVERYQEQRKKKDQKFFGLSITSNSSSDVRTPILEELKLWLLTLSEGSVQAKEVSRRLDYCMQFLLHPGLFDLSLSSGQRSFLQTLAEVCKQLESLLKDTISYQKEGVKALSEILALGHELANLSLLVLIHSLPDETSFPVVAEGSGGASSRLEAAQRECRTLEPLLPERLRLAASTGADRGDAAELGVCWSTDVGRVLGSLLRGKHFRALGASDDAETRTLDPEESESLAEASPPDASSSRGEEVSQSFLDIVEAIREGWGVAGAGAAGVVAADGQAGGGGSGVMASRASGLLLAFEAPEKRAAREGYLDLCRHLDRVVCFLAALRPYRHFLGLRGDIAMCWLRRDLGCLMQELARALVHLRDARLDVMRAAKLHLQDLAKRGFSRDRQKETRWLQRLRHVSETRLEALHLDLIERCTSVTSATSMAREMELKEEARHGLADIVEAFQSADFQSRCTLKQGVAALSQGMVEDVGRVTLALGSAAAGSSVDDPPAASTAAAALPP